MHQSLDPPDRWQTGPPAPPVVGHLPAFRRDRLGFVRRCVAEHGDAVVLRGAGRRVRLLAHPEAVQQVLAVHHASFAKSPVLQRARTVLGEGLLTVEGEAHRRRRRLVSAAFSSARIAGYAADMTAEADRLSRRWRDGEPVDVHAAAAEATLAVAVRTLMAADVDVDAVEDALADVLAAYELALLPGSRVLEATPLPAARRLRRGKAALHAIADQLIADRRARGGRGDLLSALLAASEEGDALTSSEVRDEVVTLLLAGHETTASAVTFACHLVGSARDVAEALRAEVDEVLGGRAATADDLPDLPVAAAVVAESLRLFPPSWAMARQALEDVEVLPGLWVPAGDVVVLPQWAVHRDPRWWPDAERPVVGRWTPSDRAAPRRGAWFPFGGGPRQCVGERFARSEAAIALATIAGRWDLAPVAGRPLRLAPLITLRPADGMWVRPRQRSPRGEASPHHVS